MKMNGLSRGLVLTLFFAVKSYAIIGDGSSLVASSDYPYVCEVIVSGGGFESEGHCSGTLISKQQVLTAGHCFGKDYNDSLYSISVTCGGTVSRGISKLDLPSDKNWYREITGQVKPYQNSDYALLTLDSPITKIAPLSIVKDSTRYLPTFLHDDVTCKIVGFGTDPWGNVGTLRMANLRDLALDQYEQPAPFMGGKGQTLMVKDTLYLHRRDTGELPVSCAEGDSGGTLQCQVNGQPPELVGVIGSYINDTSGAKLYNLFSPAWLLPVH